MLARKICFKKYNEMNLYYIKCSRVTNKNNIWMRNKIDWKSNLYSYCIERHSCKKFATIDGKELNDSLKE